MKSEVTSFDVSLVKDVYKSMFLDSYQVIFCDPSLQSSESQGAKQPASQFSVYGKLWRRSWTTFCDRLDKEGFSFVSKTLPRLAKAIERGLEVGFFVNRPEFGGVRGIPVFLREVLSQIFQPSGILQPLPAPGAIKWIRQFCYMYYKLELEFTDKQLSDAESKYYQNEAKIKPVAPDEVLILARKLIKSLFEGFDCLDLTPRHASGALAGREDLDGRWKDWVRYDALDVLFPFRLWFTLNGEHEEELYSTTKIRRLPYGVSRQTYVPKDSRGPRNIAMEPKEYIYLQGALLDKLVAYLEQHKLTAGHLNFTDQGINQKLVEGASQDGYYASLDLKDASDLVSLELVEYLFGDTELLKYLLALRTPFIKYGNKLHRLRKFAAMGSRLCFPTMSVCLWAISVAAAVKLQGDRPTKARQDTYVYGDDIIVSANNADAVMHALETHGLVINREKSFVYGRFRESCGKDMYNGVDVTPVRFKTPFRPFKSRPNVFEAYVSAANLLARSFPVTSKLLWERIERHYGNIPYGSERAGYPCKILKGAPPVTQNQSFELRENLDLQYYQVKTWVSVPTKERPKLEGWSRLHKVLVNGPDREPDRRSKQYGNVLRRVWCDIV